MVGRLATKQKQLTTSSMNSTPPVGPLEVILAAQNGCFSGCYADYRTAWREVQRGAKRSCWMWYIWPSLGSVRQHRMPRMLLTFPQHVSYLQHDVLGPRLLAITRLANHHLLHAHQQQQHQNGSGGLVAGRRSRRVSKEQLFGGSLDALKFHETCTAFAVAAVSFSPNEQEEAVEVFTEALFLWGGEMNQKVVEALLHDKSCERAEAWVNQVQESLVQMKLSKTKGARFLGLFKENNVRKQMAPAKKPKTESAVVVPLLTLQKKEESSNFPSDEEGDDMKA